MRYVPFSQKVEDARARWLQSCVSKALANVDSAVGRGEFVVDISTDIFLSDKLPRPDEAVTQAWIERVLASLRAEVGNTMTVTPLRDHKRLFAGDCPPDCKCPVGRLRFAVAVPPPYAQ